ncbi:MAG TPA: hypothetical protein VKX16_10125 [Chloroflexota bacterium]|nr:hypothetical protein [Chloroflexota bacterium]
MRSYMPRLFGVIWLVDASLKLTPAFRHNFLHVMAGAGDGRPGWSQSWFHLWRQLCQQHPTLWIAAITAVEFTLAIALLTGFLPRPTYALGALWSLGIWLVPEGFGYDMMSLGTDIGTSIVYVFAFVTLFAYAVPGQVSERRPVRIASQTVRGPEKHLAHLPLVSAPSVTDASGDLPNARSRS